MKKSYKKKPVKKVVKRKSIPKTKSVTNSLAALSMHHHKVLYSLFDHISFGYIACNEQETSRGAVQLRLDTTSAINKQLPLHVYDMTTILTDTTLSQYAGLQMRMSSADYPYFDISGTLSNFGVNDGAAVASTQNHNRTIQEYFDIRLELFGRDTKYTKYNVMLLKIFDEDLLPLITVDSSKGKHNNFWKHLARPYYTNSLIPADSRIMNDLKGKYKILWQKDYTMRDKDSSFDEVQRKKVKIFKKLQQLNTYNEGPWQMNYGDDNPQTLFTQTTNGASSAYPSVNKRIFLVIRGSQTQDINVGTNTFDAGSTAPGDGDICSYNIYFKTKHMIPQTTL